MKNCIELQTLSIGLTENETGTQKAARKRDDIGLKIGASISCQ